ncbi:MAG: metallophosphoesterase [Clostridiaceae bacterium]
MKKNKIMAITITIIFAIIISAVYINKPKGVTTSTTASGADLAFAVIGDVHENIDNFQIAINDLNSINSSMDALVLNGDTVDQGLDKQYDSVKATLSENKDLLPKTIIKNIGNHEFFNYNIETNSKEQVETFINKYREFSGEEKVYHDTWVKNYHFISLGSEDGNSETEDSITAFISEQQQNWLKEKLAENYQKGKPIFVFLHQNLNRLTIGNATWVGVEQSEQVKQILSQYPEVILFASHSHIDLTENSVVTEEPFTIVNTGAIHYSFVPDETSNNGRKTVQYIKGVYLEVNDNKVVIKGRDIKEKQWIFTKEISK